MIDLYALTSPNIQKVFIALEELQLPYRTRIVDTWKGEHFTPEFARLNPNQKIPLIVDHDGPGGKPHTVFESGAILIYLADKTGKLLPKDAAKRSDAIQWLMVQMSALGPYSGQLVHFSKFAPPGSDYAHSRYRTEVNRLYDVYDRQLAAHRYVAGDEYTIADIAAFPWLRNSQLLGIDLATRPNVRRLVDELDQRPAVKAMLARIATITSSRDSASDDMKDRVFGRGKYARA